MLFAYIAFSISSFAYLLPPFKQYGGRYFIFFLVLALGNPFALLVFFIFHISAERIICFIAWAMFVSLLSPKYFKKNLILLIIITILVISASLLLNGNQVQIISILFDYLILIYFIKEAVVYYKINSSIHLGYFVLILYAIGLISKLYMIISNLQTGPVYFYFTDAFEILIAIFFTIYKVEKSPKIKLKGIT